MGFVIGILLAALGAAFVVSDNLWAKPAMMMLPSFLGLIFISLLGLAQAQSGKYAAYQFSIAWFFVVVGFFITLLSTTGILTPSPVLVGAFWLSLLPQAILLISATVTRGILAERDEELEQEHMESEVESIALLKQSRDASENARLLRVIEHERQVMNELREREIKQSEDMRSARDLADEANRAKSAFLAVISHEIRTPMSGIMGMVRLLLDTKLSKEQHDYAQTIQDSGDAMLSLLNDILDFEKIESGKMDLEHIDFDLPRLVQGVVTLMSGHADAKGITLKMDMDPALPRFIVGDPVRLRQVMLNLVGNSIKFTEHGGVTILVKRDQSGEQRQGIVRIRLAVQDTGVGISREAQKNLFNPFAQADSSVSRRFGGTGLGLAISQRLIEAMGGRIAIDSTEGRGSTFYFTLMVEEGSADNAETVRGMTAAALAQKPDKVMRILVVEDNEISQKLMREFVQRLGHDITLAGSGEAALEHVNKGTFDMVLMDVELPGISGMGATKAIRALADKTKASLPVVAMTGNVRDEDVHNCYAANMNGHLAKPIDPQKLKEAIQKVIDNRLDNPVVVEESDGEYRQPQETEIKMSVDTLAAASALGLESGPGQKQDSRKDVAPIRELLLDPSTFQLDEDDLDMDSFAEAITRHEKSGTPDTEAGSVFDSRMLNGLRDGMNPDAVNKLIEEMFEKTDQIVTDLTAAVSANEIQIMGARAHELKGMAGNFGLVEVSKLAEKAERAAKEHTTEDLDMIVEALPQACKRAHNAMTLWQKGEWLD
ncbi:MAG: response regulator, partial [Alphaproteobacteria bacterium]|nr:response regulator [Alphaproteobacteria bacterium]